MYLGGSMLKVKIQNHAGYQCGLESRRVLFIKGLLRGVVANYNKELKGLISFVVPSLLSS